MPLNHEEWRIWAFRTDGIVATGIKNSGINSRETVQLPLYLDEYQKSFIDTSQRFGHPSLAVPYDDYDGSVYYAGWLQQIDKENGKYLEAFLTSGRFHNRDLKFAHLVYLEFYLAIEFNKAYGEQDILFFDHLSYKARRYDVKTLKTFAWLDQNVDNLNPFFELLFSTVPNKARLLQYLVVLLQGCVKSPKQLSIILEPIGVLLSLTYEHASNILPIVRRFLGRIALKTVQRLKQSETRTIYLKDLSKSPIFQMSSKKYGNPWQRKFDLLLYKENRLIDNKSHSQKRMLEMNIDY